jgi:hypothetical protein
MGWLEMDEDKEKDRGNSELNLPYSLRFLELNKDEIMGHLMNKIFKDKPQKVKITNSIFDRLLAELMRDVPFGTMIQIALTNALMYSFWCGTQSERLKKASEVDFKDEYIGEFQNAIIKAFAIGRNYATREEVV